MSLIKNRHVMLAMGLCLAGAAAVATLASADPSASNSQIYDSSQDITEAQGILQFAGYLAPGAFRSGVADDSTVEALQAFQTAHALLPTGSIDFETRTQLLSHRKGHEDGVLRSSLFEGKKSLVLEGVRFDNDTARLKPGSRVVLDRVAKSLNAWPDARIEIDGHTDSNNTDAYNLKLSKMRSATVCAYLVDKGVASSRLEEKGYGESRPIANNVTADGRATNRRVELTRID
jgi:OOP family OmpA-OmpF porin